MSYKTITQDISTNLQLDTDPIALSFVASAPADVPTFEGEVPSACAFWRKAETGVFYAPAEKHFNCPVGAFTMGFDMPDDVQQELMGLVEFMCDSSYLSAEEPANIPTLAQGKSGIVYGPLAEFPLEPDLVLFWLTPRQAMFYNEAFDTVQWTGESPMPTFGRPACAALPAAQEDRMPTLSLGCMGMRTFTEISEDRLLAVLPGDRAKEFSDALEQTLTANSAMQDFYEERKTQFV